MPSAPDYVVFGHMTQDVLPDGSTTLGGTSLYVATTAHRLGYSVGVVSAAAALPFDWPETIQVAFQTSAHLPTFENRYMATGRQQTLHAAASPITLAAIPRTWQDPPIVHLGPVLNELSEPFVFAFPQALLGVTPQGWMRVWDDKLPALIQYRPWRPTRAVLQRIDALVLSIEDVQGDEALVTEYAQACRLVALTRGPAGATLFLDGAPHIIPAFPASERDPTGAGDVFAAALLIYLHQTREPLEAARRAAGVAAISVEGTGTSHIPMRAAAEERLEVWSRT